MGTDLFTQIKPCGIELTDRIVMAPLTRGRARECCRSEHLHTVDQREAMAIPTIQRCKNRPLPMHELT